MNAPIAKPRSCSTPRMNPWRAPLNARSRAKTTMIQSTNVKLSGSMDHRAAPPSARWQRLERRALPVVALAAVAFIAGVVTGAGHVSGEQRTVEKFASAWRSGNYAGMWAQLTPAQQQAVSAGALAQAYRIARATATVRSFDVGKPRDAGNGAWELPVVAHTKAFGEVAGKVLLPVEGSGDSARIHWTANDTFPGVPAGARLERHTRLPRRATLLARDNRPLTTALGAYAPSIAGDLGPIPADQLDSYRAAGYPDDAQVGTSGLQKIFERQLAGRPGGELVAGGKVLAHAAPRAAHAVRTTISPSVQEAAVNALGGRL